MTGPGSSAGFEPLFAALGLAFFAVVTAWVAATVTDIAAAAAEGCRAACACREASP